MICPKCGTTMVEDTEPDEKPDGTILGYPIWKCPKCEFVDDRLTIPEKLLTYLKNVPLHTNTGVVVIGINKAWEISQHIIAILEESGSKVHPVTVALPEGKPMAVVSMTIPDSSPDGTLVFIPSR